MAFTKTLKEGELVLGDTLLYSFSLKNTGTISLHDIKITDALDGISDLKNYKVDGEPVDDLDEQGLLSAIQSLKSGKDMAGFDLDGSPEFYVGCHIAPFSTDEELQNELALAGEKIAGGARFVVTPPVFDVSRFESFMQKAAALHAPIIPTVFLIKLIFPSRRLISSK